MHADRGRQGNQRSKLSAPESKLAEVESFNFFEAEMENNMKLLTSLLAFGLLASPALAATKTFTNVSVIDVACSQKEAANADAHTRECALTCKKSGFGIVTEDKQFLKFDADGNAKILEQLKSSSKADHLRVNVTGDVQGNTLKVASVTLM
jgi:hypothetical protein